LHFPLNDQNVSRENRCAFVLIYGKALSRYFNRERCILI